MSVLGIFQHVWLTNFPAVCPRTHLVLRVRGRRTEIGVHTIRIRRAAFEAEPVTSGPALAILELRGRDRVVTRIEVPVASTLELALEPGRRR